MHHLTDSIGELGQANAVSISERLYGVASVSASVHSADNQLMGVVGVTGDASDFTDAEIAHLILEVRRAATLLGQRLLAQPDSTRQATAAQAANWCRAPSLRLHLHHTFTAPICLGLEANGHNQCHKPAVGPAGRAARRGWRDA